MVPEEEIAMPGLDVAIKTIILDPVKKSSGGEETGEDNTMSTVTVGG
jgi:hypothetical protein